MSMFFVYDLGILYFFYPFLLFKQMQKMLMFFLLYIFLFLKMEKYVFKIGLFPVFKTCEYCPIHSEIINTERVFGCD